MEGIDVRTLSTEQKIGQMLLMRNPVDRGDLDFVIDLVRARSLGGIHISHKYVKDGYYVKSEREILDRILEAADYPILVCEDMEYGFPGSAVSLPYQLALGSADSEDLAYEYGRITAIEAKAAGYNTVFGPIMDIAQNPKSCCVGSRSFGGTRELVARMAAATIRGYQDQGMVVTAKHFPGFGESATDNHIAMVYLRGDRHQLRERELYPYGYAMRHADLSGVMMGHIMVPKVDPDYPASISGKMIGLLRDMGYDGLIMTDSLAMVGLTNLFPIADCHKLAMKAGNDMVMTSYRMGAREAYGYMLDAYREGMVTASQIDAAAARVARAQERTLRKASQGTLAPEDAAVADLMAASAISVHLDGADSPAVERHAKHLIIVQEGVLYRDPASGETKKDSCDLEAAVEELKKEFPESDLQYLPEFPVKPQLEHVMAKSLGYASVIMILANKSVSYTGSSDATQRMVSIINGLRHKISAIVLFGCPYAAREFGKIRRIIYGYDGKACQRYAVRTLAGTHAPRGKLPVEFGCPGLEHGES